MYKCNGLTAVGARCRRNVVRKDGFCTSHVPKDDDRLTLDTVPCFRDGDSTQRACGHSCALTLSHCCECTDKRPRDIRDRAKHYCRLCKPRCTPQSVPMPRRHVFYDPFADDEDNAIFVFFVQHYAER